MTSCGFGDKHIGMKIRFLRKCVAPQNRMEIRCSCCGPQPAGSERINFYKGEEYDPEEYGHEIDLSGLTFREDYDIIEYP